MPTHQYGLLATQYAYSSNPSHSLILQNLSGSCRAYTRVVLRLRAQAEAMAAFAARQLPRPESTRSPISHSHSARGTSPAVSHRSQSGWPSPSRVPASRSSSRAPSPASSFTHSRSGHVAPRSVDHQQSQGNAGAGGIPTFRSPLFRPRRAPLLQVFVPSPESDWLSDAGVLDCEQELQRAGVLHLMRAGDVVWDAAVGDEGNVGRLVWDGSYLIVSTETLALVYQFTDRIVPLAGSGLHVLSDWRPAALPPDRSIPAIVFPSCYPNDGKRESSLSH